MLQAKEVESTLPSNFNKIVCCNRLIKLTIIKVRPVRRRLCRLYAPTPTPTNWGTQRIGNHPRQQHDLEPDDIALSFGILKKCQNKFFVLFSKFFFNQRPKTNAKKTVWFNPCTTRICLKSVCKSLLFFIALCLLYVNFYNYFIFYCFLTVTNIFLLHLALENDLRKVETSWIFIFSFYH